MLEIATTDCIKPFFSSILMKRDTWPESMNNILDIVDNRMPNDHESQLIARVVYLKICQVYGGSTIYMPYESQAKKFLKLQFLHSSESKLNGEKQPLWQKNIQSMISITESVMVELERHRTETERFSRIIIGTLSFLFGAKRCYLPMGHICIPTS